MSAVVTIVLYGLEGHYHPDVLVVEDENVHRRLRKVFGFIHSNVTLARRVVSLMLSRELGWVTTGSFIDGRQGVRTINRYTPEMNCDMHVDGHPRCLDIFCRLRGGPFQRESKIVEAHQAKKRGGFFYERS